MDTEALASVVQLIGSNLRDDLDAIGDHIGDAGSIRERLAHAHEQLRALMAIASSVVSKGTNANRT